MLSSGTTPTTIPQTMVKTMGEVSALLGWELSPTHFIPIATACEVLARRIVHLSPPERLPVIMSSRFQHRQLDGDISDMTSALEMAIDSNW
jgi:hypothetical protein